jgi:hypothetical protein
MRLRSAPVTGIASDWIAPHEGIVHPELGPVPRRRRGERAGVASYTAAMRLASIPSSAWSTLKETLLTNRSPRA